MCVFAGSPQACNGFLQVLVCVCVCVFVCVCVSAPPHPPTPVTNMADIYDLESA